MMRAVIGTVAVLAGFAVLEDSVDASTGLAGSCKAAQAYALLPAGEQLAGARHADAGRRRGRHDRAARDGPGPVHHDRHHDQQPGRLGAHRRRRRRTTPRSTRRRARPAGSRPTRCRSTRISTARRQIYSRPGLLGHEVGTGAGHAVPRARLQGRVPAGDQRRQGQRLARPLVRPAGRLPRLAHDTVKGSGLRSSGKSGEGRGTASGPGGQPPGLPFVRSSAR